MSNLYRGPSIDASYQVLVHLAKRFQRRYFRNQPIRNKNCLWRPHLVTDQDEMSNLYRGPSIAASYPVSVHLVMQFQRRRSFRNQPIRNKNCLWWPCLLTDRDEISNLYRGPCIDASYPVLVNLAMRFQRRRLKCEKLMHDGHQVMAKAHIPFRFIWPCGFRGIHVIELLCYNWRFANFWLEIWSHNWRFFIEVFDACFYCLLMFSFCLFRYWTNCIPFQYILFTFLSY